MTTRRIRRSPLVIAVLACSLLGIQLGAQAWQAPQAQASPTQTDSAVIGWDGDRDAAMAHSDGSFDIRAGKNITARFGIFNSPQKLQWTNVDGYLPALSTTFERDNSTVTITNFADKVTHGGNDFVAVYSRVTVKNHDDVPHTLDPAPSAGLIPLSNASKTVTPGETVHHDYVIAADKFGGSYDWPTDGQLAGLGGYDAHFTHMKQYWDARLAKVAQVNLPDKQLVNAYKAGFINMHIVKDGNDLHVGENGYDRIFDHDLIGMLVSLLEQGDLDNAKAYLQTLTVNQYPDAGYKFSWPWAVYLRKTGDTAFVSEHFDKISEQAHGIETSRTGPDGIMKVSGAIDADGLWTVDNESALMGLLAYRSITEKLGKTSETQWAAAQYDSLLKAVNDKLSKTINDNGLDYIPCAMDRPNSANRCSATNDANWASSLLFGRWTWDGYLFNGKQEGPLIDLLDKTYKHGFDQLSGLPAHTYGGYPGVSSAYNAGYGSAGLRGKEYRSEGIYGYEYMITNTQAAPFSWWEGINKTGTTSWSPGEHTTSGGGSSPHMWGQSNATKVLVDSLIAERSDGEVIVGRGIPAEWLRDGQKVSVANYPIANNHRMGAEITSSGDTVRLNLNGDAPAGKISFSLPAFVGNISSSSAGEINNADGTVSLPSGTRSVTVKLTKAPTYKALGGVDFDGYCKSVGNTGGVTREGDTAASWKCVTSAGERVGVEVDEACTYAYPYNPAVFSRAVASDPYSWTCYAS